MSVKPDDVVTRVSKALADATEPLTVRDLAAITGFDDRECDSALWDHPEVFAWQPGHRWCLVSPSLRGRGGASPRGVGSRVRDVRSQPLEPRVATELKAITLSTGTQLRVRCRSLDSDAVFSVRGIGSNLELTLNSTHEVFDGSPLPFVQADDEAGYKKLLEILLKAWALHEDGTMIEKERRALQETRLLWGRRVYEVLRENE